MEISIRQSEQLPQHIENLAALATQEGYIFIQRLIDEFQSGKTVLTKRVSVYWWPMMVTNLWAVAV